MTCSTDTRSIHRGSTEYLKVTLTSDVTLDAQPVEFSLDDGTTWLSAEAVGSAAMVRQYRHLLTPEEQPDKAAVVVLVRITDNPEIPIIEAGTLSIIT